MFHGHPLKTDVVGTRWHASTCPTASGPASHRKNAIPSSKALTQSPLAQGGVTHPAVRLHAAATHPCRTCSDSCKLKYNLRSGHV